MKWFVYILHCSNDTLYVGHTNNVANRFARHRAGSGARHTATNPPDKVVHTEEYSSELEAIRREHQLKRWTHAKKLALLSGNMERLHLLSRNHKNK